jgi:hypothetical protein
LLALGAIVTLGVVGELTVKFTVAALSQPTALIKGAVCVPAAVKVKPFQL